jgi:hypothetical protein
VASKKSAPTSIKVIAHERRKPTRNATGPTKSTAQHTTDQLAENAFGADASRLDEQDVGAITGGLAGEPKVNHLKAAIGFMRRK